MRGFNKIVLMGNLTRDPDVRFTPSKQKVARFTVAVGRQWKDKNSGQQQSHTDFINIVAWSFLADLCEKYLKKGRPVLVEGRISVRDYEDQKTGQKRWITEVVADNVVLLSGGNKDASNGYAPDGYAQSEPKPDVPGDMGYTQPTFADEFPLDSQATYSPDVDIPF